MELAQIFFIGTVGATVGFALGVFITMVAYRKNKQSIIRKEDKHGERKGYQDQEA